MPRVRFLSDFDFKPSAQVTVAYKAGTEKLVKAVCAEKAIAAGKAEEIKPKAKPADGE
ncbi:hypothetical protein [Tianweitania sediminis]|uniref:Uncharacterized protein n=1 Tax=Tianweitania sediminis TaxID=1502156 RepID=A0A8J7QYQ5_9HYPH|nr:hypothetical protein [Tianweitania sediminis]MBP0438425.1 hypothetical protein [Tianweitania sediminis]